MTLSLLYNGLYCTILLLPVIFFYLLVCYRVFWRIKIYNSLTAFHSVWSRRKMSVCRSIEDHVTLSGRTGSSKQTVALHISVSGSNSSSTGNSRTTCPTTQCDCQQPRHFVRRRPTETATLRTVNSQRGDRCVSAGSAMSNKTRLPGVTSHVLGDASVVALRTQREGCGRCRAKSVWMMCERGARWRSKGVRGWGRHRAALARGGKRAKIVLNFTCKFRLQVTFGVQ